MGWNESINQKCAPAAAIAALLGLAFAASAEVLLVPDDYGTIQSAVNAADDGDEILVAPGLYTEKINFNGKAVLLHSSGGPDVTTIEHPSSGSVVKCVSGEQSDTVLDGFTVTGGGGTFNGGGMENTASSPTVVNCYFVGNSAERGGGMGNVLASPIVTNCRFIDNFAENGGGMSNYFESSPVVTGCSFIGNSASYAGGGINNSYDSAPTILDCTFTDNTGYYYGGGMYSINAGPVAAGCLFEANSAAVSTDFGGGGGVFSEVSESEFYGCDFVRNTTVAWGGGMNLLDSTPTFIDCEFIANAANKGGALAYSYSDPLLINCLFTTNTADVSSGTASSHRSTPAFINCTLAGNYAPEVGGIRIKQDPADGGTTVDNCVLWGNEDDSGVVQDAQIYILWADPALVSVDYSCVQGWTGTIQGVGTIADDPNFVLPPNPGDDGAWGTEDDEEGDCRIAAGSPCIDAADNTALPDDIEADLDGNFRFVDDPDTEDTGIGEYGDPAIVDMGAYEFQLSICLGDINGDRSVDVVDLLILLATWGPCPPEGSCFGDLDESGEVDVLDMLILLSVWGPC